MFWLFLYAIIIIIFIIIFSFKNKLFSRIHNASNKKTSYWRPAWCGILQCVRCKLRLDGGTWSNSICIFHSIKETAPINGSPEGALLRGGAVAPEAQKLDFPSFFFFFPFRFHESSWEAFPGLLLKRFLSSLFHSFHFYPFRYFFLAFILVH